jgi:hypothetical protein
MFLSEAKTSQLQRIWAFHNTIPAQWTVLQPQQVQVSSQGVMSSNFPGLSPIEGQEFKFGTPARSRD